MSQWSRRDVIAGGAVLLAGLLAGCRPSERQDIEIEDLTAERPSWLPSQGPTSGEVLAGLDALLQRRADALLQDDEEAFLADLDPANTRMVDAQRLFFRNLRQFDVDEFRFMTRNATLLPDETGVTTVDPVIAIIKLSVDDARGGVAPGEAYQYKLTRDGDGTVVTDIVRITRKNVRKLESSADVYAEAPWHYNELEVHNVENVWLVGDDTVPDLADFADAARAHVADIEDLWGDRPKFPGYVLFFSRNRKRLKKWYGQGKRIDTLDGYASPEAGVRKNGSVSTAEYAGSRVVVNLGSIEEVSNSNTADAVIRHELAHAVTERAFDAPAGFMEGFDRVTWAVEGFARWVEVLDSAQGQSEVRAVVADGLARGWFDGLPPASATFHDEFRGEQLRRGFNYAVSSTIFSFIERSAGARKAVEVYARVIKHTDIDGLPFATSPAFDGICRSVLGTGGQEFLGEWDAFVRQGA